MKVNLNKTLKTFRGEDMKDEFGKVQVIKDIQVNTESTSGTRYNVKWDSVTGLLYIDD